jgi:RimJ/RimL family protein N-acetyltransferase
VTEDSEPQPIGAPVDVHPAKRPERVTLKGRFVSLAPLDAVKHAVSLYDGSNGEPVRERVWTYLFDGPYANLHDFRANLETKAASADPLFFAVVDNATGRALGYQTLMRIDEANRVIEVGNIMYTPALQRTPGATEAQYLFAAYVFDALGYRRYEWKCNALNAPSRRAAERLGFSFEGIFRQALIVKGRNRDTAWYSMLDSEWPARKDAFERWLRRDNFDDKGRQKQSLASLRPA